MCCHETTSVSTVEPRGMASRTAESQRTNAMSASSTEEVTGPTAPSTSLKFELLPWSKQRHTRLPPLQKTPLWLSGEWTLNRCKPTSGTKRMSQRSRKKAKPSEYSGCSPGNSYICNSFSSLVQLTDMVLFPLENTNLNRSCTEQTAPLARLKCSRGSNPVLHPSTKLKNKFYFLLSLIKSLKPSIPNKSTRTDKIS